MTAGTTPVGRLLFVCTGNICRSAAAEVLARRYVEGVLGEASRPVHVSSAGTRAVVGAAMHSDSAAAVRALGGDVDGFVARRLRPVLVAEADLVLTMTREHRQVVLGLEPRALSRTFTLREAADLVRLAAAPSGQDGRADSLAFRMHAARRLRRSSDGDDIADPITGPADLHREAVAAIAGCLPSVLDALLADRGVLSARR